AHAVADDLATAELHLVAIDGEVPLHLDQELGIRQPHPIADGRPKKVRILSSRNPQAHAVPPAVPPKPAAAARVTAAARAAVPVGPSVNAFNPCTSRAPASSTSSTTFSSP